MTSDSHIRRPVEGAARRPNARETAHPRMTRQSGASSPSRPIRKAMTRAVPTQYSDVTKRRPGSAPLFETATTMESDAARLKTSQPLAGARVRFGDPSGVAERRTPRRFSGVLPPKRSVFSVRLTHWRSAASRAGSLSRLGFAACAARRLQRLVRPTAGRYASLCKLHE